MAPTPGEIAKARLRPIMQSAGWDLKRYPQIDGLVNLRSEFINTRGIDLVVDVGANVGQYGGWIRKAGYKGKIISIEPMSDAFVKLEAAASKDPNWRTVRSALDAQPGQLPINISRNSISSSLLPMEERHATRAPQSEYVETEVVPVERLDALISDDITAAARPYLKIDTQGYEARVLEGGAGVLGKFAGIELEMSLVSLYSGQELMLELMERMNAAGFRLAVVTPGLLDVEKGEMLQVDGIFAPIDA